MKFTGNFGTVNGVMAADKFIFTGNAGGIVDGGIICYSDSDFTLTGNSHLKIDRKKYTGTPPGFTQPTKMSPLAGTYTEF